MCTTGSVRRPSDLCARRNNIRVTIRRNCRHIRRPFFTIRFPPFQIEIGLARLL